MKKRFLSVFIALSIILTMLPYFSVFAEFYNDLEVPFSDLDDTPATVYTSGDFKYTVSYFGATIVDYTGSADTLIIPDTLDGINVVSIGDKAFYESSLGTESPSSITLPSTVTFIGRYAFAWCMDLETINLPASLKTIEEAAFAGTGITSVSIPAATTLIGKRAFADCRSLTSITVAAENTAFSASNGILYSKDMSDVVCVPSGLTQTAVTIPEGVTSIGISAFFGCRSVISVSLPSSLTTVSDEAFGFCTSLEAITLPISVTEIGKWAFAHCENMTSISIPDGVTNIGDEAFLLCESLTSITLPSCITSIGYSTFAGCYNLTYFSIPDDVISIGDLAFYYCNALTSIMIPESVTTFGENIFDECTALTTVYLYEGSCAETFVTSNLTGVNTVYISSFLNFTGFQVRESDYNGLRSIFEVDSSQIDEMETNGLTVVEYGTLMASTEKLAANNDELTICKNNSGYESKNYARKVSAYTGGEFVGEEAKSPSKNVKFACTITNYNKDNYQKEVTIRGYAVLRGSDGNEFVVYADYPNQSYRSLSLKSLVADMVKAGAIKIETNISYLYVTSFEAE